MSTTRAVHVQQDEESDNEISINLPPLDNSETDSIDSKIMDVPPDPFAKKLEKVRQLDGLGPSTKRRMTREIKKYKDTQEPLAEGRNGAKSKARTDKYATGYGAFDVVEPPYNLEYLAKLYEISPAHMAAVDAKVTNTVGLGFNFVESNKTEERLASINNEDTLKRVRTRVDNAKYYLMDWMDTLNNEETFLETLRKVMTDLETTGNGYFEIGRTTSGKIGYIGHLHSPTIRRRVQKDGYVQVVAGRATFFRNYGDEKTADPIGTDRRPNEVIHLSKYTPSNSYYGVPDVLSARNAIAGEEFASRFNLDYFEHKAVPRYIVVLKNAKLSQTAENRLVNFLQSGLKGKHHRTLYVPLPADSENQKVEFKLEPVEAKITDASFTKYKEMNRDEVLMAHRVPLTQIGFTANVSLGASKDSARMFKEQVCRPWQDIFEQRLKPVFRERTDAFNFHLTELTLTDEETASRVNERLLRWDVVTPNEIREWLGKKGREGGDETVGVMSQARLKVDNDQQQQANQTRERDAERSGGPDADQSDRSRNPQGEGRQTE